MAVNILLKGKQKNLGGKRQTMGKLKSWISNLRKKEQRLTVRSYLPKGGRAWMCVKVINRVLKVKKNLKRNAKRNDWGPEQDAKFLVEVCWAKARNHTPPWGGTRKKRGSQMEDPIKCGVPGLKRCAQGSWNKLVPNSQSTPSCKLAHDSRFNLNPMTQVNHIWLTMNHGVKTLNSYKKFMMHGVKRSILLLFFMYRFKK